MKKPQPKRSNQPLRKCVGCGQMIDKGKLVRINRNKDGEINVDFSGKMQGRAAYLCLNAECLQKAKKAKGLERSFKGAVPAETYVQLESHISGI